MEVFYLWKLILEGLCCPSPYVSLMSPLLITLIAFDLQGKFDCFLKSLRLFKLDFYNSFRFLVANEY